MTGPAAGGDPPGPPQVVVIVGVGLIGASIGCALTAAGVRVHLRDTSASHAAVAAGLGAGVVEPADPQAVDLVVVAVPPRALAEVIADSLRTYPRAAVTDVGSVKAGVLAELWQTSTPLERYVGSHPMAGSHRSGPVAARPDLFVDRTWVITPHRRSEPAAVRAVEGVATACGAHLVRMDVEDHDAAVARVSHLPHLMAVLVAGHLTEAPDAHLLLAGQGLRDVTRIAAGDPALWEQIVAANSSAVLAELYDLQKQLTGVIEAIEAGPAGSDLRGQLERAVRGTRRIPGKHGMAPVDYTQVVVEIPDAPGALGRLFADVGAAGVNVEDIAIEHDAVRPLGYLALSVRPEQGPALRALMSAAGWTVDT
ncbi:MAG: prephenate dehydrogenase [Actinomycetes bacterium]